MQIHAALILINATSEAHRERVRQSGLLVFDSLAERSPVLEYLLFLGSVRGRQKRCRTSPGIWIFARNLCIFFPTNIDVMVDERRRVLSGVPLIDLLRSSRFLR